MRRISASVVLSALMIVLAAPETDAARQGPTLGSRNYPGAGFPGRFPGFGTAAPRLISANGEAASAAAAPHWRTLTIHRAWLETVVGARRVRERAHADTDTVQHESGCVRHSRYVVDCPFRYVIGSELAENFERCNDIGRVTEIAAGRFSFAARKPGCALINNETP